MTQRRKPAFGTLRPPGWNRPRVSPVSTVTWHVYHVCSFHTLWHAAMTIGEMERLAGLCDREVLWKLCDRIYHGQSPWQNLMQILKRRALLRYERGELTHEERIAYAIWCGEDRHLPGFVRPPQDKASASEPEHGSVPVTTKGPKQSAGVEGRLQLSVNR